MNTKDDIVELSESNDDDCVLESVIYEEPKTSNNKMNFDNICKENPLLGTFMNNCLNLENSFGMKRAIYRTLLRIYIKADKNFIQSQKFEKALRRAINLVKYDPSHKFSHVKDLCNILKYGTVRKRAQLITLSRNISRKASPELPHTNNNLDSFEETPIIDLDTLSDDKSIDGEKENHSNITCSQSSAEGDKLLVPQKVLEYEAMPNSNKEQIEKIENEIASYKEILLKLDEEEVCFDSVNSPYVKSEKIKEKIVALYKELCKLTGAEHVKKRSINLKVIDGHPPGPVRRLERFLNRNIGDNGDPPFPNFRDVVKCVLIANEKDNLGWSRQQVMKEATALFTYCGRALQKRRQRREWHDLLSKVKKEECNDDPADEDPELLAQLEANRRIAYKKEMEVLERFSMMQNVVKISTANQMNEIQVEESDSDIGSSSDESCDMEPQDSSTSQLPSTSHNEYDLGVDIKHEASINTESIVKVKKEPLSNVIHKLEELGDDYTTTIVEIEDPYVTIDISDSSDEESN